MIPETMRAMVLTGHGGLGMLDLRNDVAVPTPGHGEVLIEVSACGINNTDVNTRTGWYRGGGWGGDLSIPRIQGADPVGRIVAVGSDVGESRTGERVLVDAWFRSPSGSHDEAEYLGSERDGGFAEYVTVPAANAYPIDSQMSDIELASFPCSYATAEHMLHRVELAEGEWVLVTGASGGVGSALVQLSKRRGARVVAITSSTKLDAIRDLGADVVLDRSKPDLSEQVIGASGRVDVLADVVGGPLFPDLFDTIRPQGRYVVSGAVAGATVPLDLRTLYLGDIVMHGATVLPPRVFRDLVGYIERGEVHPVVAATYPLSQMREAQEAFMRREHVGSILIEVK